MEEEKVCAESEVWAHPLIQAITTFQPLPNLPRPMISSFSNTAYPLQSQTSIHYNTFDSATNTSYLPHSTLLNSATPVFQARISSHQKRSSTRHWPIQHYNITTNLRYSLLQPTYSTYTKAALGYHSASKTLQAVTQDTQRRYSGSPVL